MILWLVIALMTVSALALVLVPLVLRHRRAPRRVEFDLAVYRDQLEVLESDRARGLVGEDQTEAARLEIQRRMLTASKQDGGTTAAKDGNEGLAALDMEQVAPEPGGAKRNWLLMAAIGAAIPALAVAVYLVLGSPGTPGKPFSGVAQQGGATGEDMAGQPIEAAISNLVKRLEEDPDNLEGWLLLGRSLITLERYEDAAQALRTAVTLSDGDPEIIGSMAETLVFAAQGIVTTDALVAFQTVLSMRPNDVAAQYYIGISLAQQGRPGDALEMWRKLAAETPVDAPWRADLITWMRRAAEETGTELGSIPSAPASARQTAETASGPSQEDIAAAAEMSPEERMDMIRSMVEQLAARLVDEPDDLDGWLRLGRSYSVLGRHAESRDAYARAADIAPDDTAVLRGYARAVMNAAGDATQFPEQAITLYQRILELDPNQLEALWFMGFVEAADGHSDTARGFWNRLLDLLPPGSADRGVVERALKDLPD